MLEDGSNPGNKTFIERLAAFVANSSQKEKKLDKIKTTSNEAKLEIYDPTVALKKTYEHKTQTKIDKELNEELDKLKKFENKEGVFSSEIGSDESETDDERSSKATTITETIQSTTSKIKMTTNISKTNNTNTINKSKVSEENNNEVEDDDNETTEYTTTKKYEESDISGEDNNFESENKTLITINNSNSMKPTPKNNQTFNDNITTLNLESTSFNSNETKNNENETITSSKVLLSTKTQSLINVTTVADIEKYENQTNNINRTDSSNPTHDLIAALVAMQSMINTLEPYNNLNETQRSLYENVKVTETRNETEKLAENKVKVFKKN